MIEVNVLIGWTLLAPMVPEIHFCGEPSVAKKFNISECLNDLKKNTKIKLINNGRYWVIFCILGA